jgi:hypothetical protein
MPGDFVTRFIVLNDTDAIELDDAAEFMSKGPK